MRTFTLHSALDFLAVYSYFKYGEPLMAYSAISAVALFSILFFMLWLSTYLYNRSYYRKLPRLFELVFFFIKELLVANMKIAYDIVTPHYYMRPTIIALPLKARTDLEISLLANIISLTPGTLSIDVADDRKTLYIHALYIKNNDIEQLKLHIKNGFERRILELTT